MSKLVTFPSINTFCRITSSSLPVFKHPFGKSQKLLALICIKCWHFLRPETDIYDPPEMKTLAPGWLFDGKKFRFDRMLACQVSLTKETDDNRKCSNLIRHTTRFGGKLPRFPISEFIGFPAEKLDWKNGLRSLEVVQGRRKTQKDAGGRWWEKGNRKDRKDQSRPRGTSTKQTHFVLTRPEMMN